MAEYIIANNNNECQNITPQAATINVKM